MSLAISHLYDFGEFRLDTKEKILMCQDVPIELTPKAFELLTLFVENPGRLLKKDEIMEKIWAESFVEESNLTFNIGQLRKILGDDAQQPVFIKTVRQHGYRFIAPVKEVVEEKLLVKTAEDLSPKPIEDISRLVSETTNKSFLEHISRPNFAFVGLAILLISGLALALILYENFRRKKPDAPILKTDFKSGKLTNTGGVFHAVISPDGKRMAYTSENGGKNGVWIRQFETSENVQIIPNSDEFYGGLGFSRDGETLYFTRTTLQNKIQIIYRVSVLGGVPKEIVSGTEGWFSISPDDHQISFVRCPYREEDYCSLFIADVDGKNERQLLTRPRPIRIGDNQFSPDGKSIAVALGQSRSGSQDFGLLEIDVETGKEREITKQKFFNIKYLSWLPDKSGILLTAYEHFYRVIKIYQVSNETGEVQTLTKDSNNYNRISLDNSFQKLVATQAVSDFRLWIAPTDNPASAKPISAAYGNAKFTSSGKIFYSSITDGTPNIWTINADGTNQRQLTSNQEANSDPLITADERYIYFASNRSGSAQVWRMNLDGSNQRQVSEGDSGVPIFVSTDGNTVFYLTVINNNLGEITVNNEGNFVSSIVSKERMFSPEINSAGETVAYFSRKEDGIYEIVLMSLAKGKILKSFQLAEKSEPIRVVWANDSKSLFYLAGDVSKTTIWQLSLETGRSVKFTEFSDDEEVSDFALSPDGKTFAYVRGKWRHDAVLIEGLK